MVANADDEVMCLCTGTKRGQIQQLFLDGFTQEEISRKTGVLSGCAGCEWDIAQFLKQLSEQN